MVDGMEAQVILPHRQRRAAHQGGFTLDGARMPDIDRFLGAQAGAVEKRAPVHAGGLLREVLGGPGIVGLDDVFRLFALGVRGGNLAFQLEHARGAAVGILPAGQLEQRRDVLLILHAQGRHLGVLGQIIFAVGQAQPALQQVSLVMRRIVQALGNPQAEHVFGKEIGRIQRIDVGAQRAAEQVRQRALVRRGGDAIKRRQQRRQTLGFDADFIHVGRIKRADAARIVGRIAATLAGLFDQLRDALVGQLGDLAVDAPIALVRRNRRGVDPAAIDVAVEVVAGAHTGFHAAHDIRRRQRKIGCADRHGGTEQHGTSGGDQGEPAQRHGGTVANQGCMHDVPRNSF